MTPHANKEEIEAGCPIPVTHGRLDQAHILWHDTAKHYCDPHTFRTYLNATIQVLRNVTFALQSEKRNVPNFDAWYETWQQRLRDD